jgi:uncharacterized membrane protein
VPLYKAYCQDYVDYRIQLNVDNSAGWTITKVSDINASIDVENFPTRVTTLIDAASAQTQREMVLNVDSLQVSDEISWETQSRTTVYVFIWQNFSTNENGNIETGDVFVTPDFFSTLFGDGAIQITYPSTYSVQSVAPTPGVRDDSARWLKWFRTQDFINGNPNLAFGIIQNEESNEWQPYAIIGAVLTVVIAALLVGFYLIKARKSKARTSAKTYVGTTVLESDEEKIIKLIRSSGGSMRQSEITERCRFSKAKTSLLLAVLEQNKVITRYKRGRDKIVTLSERVAGDQS